MRPRAAPAWSERHTAEHLAATGVARVQDLDAWSLRGLARDSVKLLEKTAGRGIPPDPFAQAIGAVEAVLRSWTSPRACEYRRLNGLDERSGTGILIQAMVFGNSGARSGSGVGFTRNPATGADELFIDFLFNAQGEDIVSGRLPLAERNRLSAALPDVWAELHAARPLLEREFRDMQDFEFTVEAGRLFFLQTRAGKRTPWAALQIAVDLVKAGSLDRASAIDRLAPYDLAPLTRVAVRPRSSDVPIAVATSASVGVATGEVVFDADRARQLAADRPVILAREDLTTDDIAGLAASAGVIATHGARTSHAAVVARQLGKVCLVGCAALRIDAEGREAAIGARRVREGDVLTLDGETGGCTRDACR